MLSYVREGNKTRIEWSKEAINYALEAYCDYRRDGLSIKDACCFAFLVTFKKAKFPDQFIPRAYILEEYAPGLMAHLLERRNKFLASKIKKS